MLFLMVNTLCLLVLLIIWSQRLVTQYSWGIIAHFVLVVATHQSREELVSSWEDTIMEQILAWIIQSLIILKVHVVVILKIVERQYQHGVRLHLQLIHRLIVQQTYQSRLVLQKQSPTLMPQYGITSIGAFQQIWLLKLQVMLRIIKTIT